MTETDKPRIRVFLIDDHFMVRSGLRASLSIEPDLEIVGEADSIETAKAALDQGRVDVVLVDLRLPDGSGIEIVRFLNEGETDARSIILSVNAGEHEILEAVQAGASAYLHKSVDRAELVDAIRDVAQGGAYFPASIRRKLEAGQARSPLSNREQMILRAMVAGSLNKEIAANYGISEATTKQHVSAILRKLGVQNRTQAVVAAVERGIVRLG